MGVVGFVDVIEGVGLLLYMRFGGLELLAGG